MIKYGVTFVVIFLMLLQTFSVNAREFSVGDTLYVWANDGLVMRKEPKFDSQALMKLDYGTAIIVAERPGGELEFVVTSAMSGNKTTLAGISVFGEFVKIHYNGMDAFVFDGFLSRLVPMHNKEPLTDYLNRIYGQLQLIDRSNKETEYRFKRVIYKTGIVYEFEGGRENWVRDLCFIPGISMNEAYLLINRSTGFEENYKRRIKEGASYFDQYPQKFERNEIVIAYELGQQTIRGGDNHVLITNEFGN